MKQIAIIGGGPAGLMSAEIIAAAGLQVTVYDQMPSVGRKFLMAGRGGLNLTHSEDLEKFLTRYGATSSWLTPVVRNYPPSALLDWCHGLDQETFVGTSGRIFPKGLKASPLLRTWLRRLDKLNVKFALKHKWIGWNDKNQLTFQTADGKTEHVKADAVLLALGGASWPRLGSDGSWTEILKKRNVAVTQLAPANCGFLAAWSDIFRERFAGQPLKPVTVSYAGEVIQGEVLITSGGIEGGVIYALSSRLRDALTKNGRATITLDLRPGLSATELTAKLNAPRGSQSLTNHLRKFSGLSPAAIGLLYETAGKDVLQNALSEQLAHIIKACSVKLTASASITRAISNAGGIARAALDDNFMLKEIPGVFAAGEMLDWEAPTGGYLLQASFSTAVAAAQGLLKWT